MLTVRLFGQSILFFCLLGAILFGAAGDVEWRAAWIFLLETVVLTFGLSFWLLGHDPSLLRTRMTSPFASNQAPRDRALIGLIGAGFVIWLVVMGLDHRAGRAISDKWQIALGASIVAGTYLLTAWTFAANSFAAPQIRIQAERSQRVVDKGPYKFVRHPMYSGALLYFFGIPLLFGSWRGLLGGLALAALMSLRAVLEEDLLRRDLPGYRDYLRRVRWRLLPGLW